MKYRKKKISHSKNREAWSEYEKENYINTTCTIQETNKKAEEVN